MIGVLNCPARALATVLVAVAGLAGCAQDQSTEASPDLLSAVGDPVVSAADPDTGSAGTLGQVVTISGSNFDRGSTTQWLRSDGLASQVTVRSTKYVSPTKLQATIDIAATADTAKYDIAVTTSNGRKGIGIELYAVQQKAGTNPTVRMTFSEALGDGSGLATGVRNDVAGQWYQHQVCGARVTINKNAVGPQADFLLDPDIDYNNGLNCARRYFNFLPITGTNPTPYRGGQATGYQIIRDFDAIDLPVGNSQPRNMIFSLDAAVTGCSGVAYYDNYQGTGASGLTVTLVAVDALGRRRWIVRSNSPHRPSCTVPAARKSASPTYVLMPPLPLEFVVEEVDKGVGPWP